LPFEESNQLTICWHLALDCSQWTRIMRNDFFPGDYLGQKPGDSNFSARHVIDLGPDLGYGDAGSVLFPNQWPFGMSENYDPW
jgi:hypothetical protein